MDKKVKCRFCLCTFDDEDIKYEVNVSSMDSCDVRVPVEGEFLGKKVQVFKMSEKVHYTNVRAILCEKCVCGASIEEVISFGEKIRLTNHVANTVGEGYCPVEGGVVELTEHELTLIEDQNQEDEW